MKEASKIFQVKRVHSFLWLQGAPDPCDHLDKVKGDIADVHVSEHNQQVGEATGHGGPGEDVDGREVSNKSNDTNDKRRPVENIPGIKFLKTDASIPMQT